jgi:hypothetical protein
MCCCYLHAHKGIFCINYSERGGGFAPCKGAWCPRCYVPFGIRDFPIQKKSDNDGDEVVKEEDSTRFLWAKAGNHDDAFPA